MEANLMQRLYPQTKTAYATLFSALNRKDREMIRLFLPALLLAFWTVSTKANDREISGMIVGIVCGDATSFVIKTDTGKKLAGACLEPWCDGICGSSNAKQRVIGKRISAKSRVTNMEEPTDGVQVNEFYNILIE